MHIRYHSTTPETILSADRSLIIHVIRDARTTLTGHKYRLFL